MRCRCRRTAGCDWGSPGIHRPPGRRGRYADEGVEINGRFFDANRQEFVSRATALVADELDPFERSLRERLDVEAGDARSARKVVTRIGMLKSRIESLMRELGELAK